MANLATRSSNVMSNSGMIIPKWIFHITHPIQSSSFHFSSLYMNYERSFQTFVARCLLKHFSKTSLITLISKTDHYLWHNVTNLISKIFVLQGAWTRVTNWPRRFRPIFETILFWTEFLSFIKFIAQEPSTLGLCTIQSPILSHTQQSLPTLNAPNTPIFEYFYLSCTGNVLLFNLNMYILTKDKINP